MKKNTNKREKEIIDEIQNNLTSRRHAENITDFYAGVTEHLPYLSGIFESIDYEYAFKYSYKIRYQ